MKRHALPHALIAVVFVAIAVLTAATGGLQS